LICILQVRCQGWDLSAFSNSLIYTVISAIYVPCFLMVK
jgi:hypothetical protein